MGTSVDKKYIATLVGIAIFAAGHLFTAIWFASGINTKVSFMATRIDNLAESISALASVKTDIDIFQRVDAAVTNLQNDVRDHLLDNDIHRAKLTELEGRIRALEAPRHALLPKAP